MKIRTAPAPLLAAIAVVIGAVAAVVLSFSSQPSDLDLRMAQIRSTFAEAKRLVNQPGSIGTLPEGAVCRSALATAAAGYSSRLTKRAASRGIPIDGLRLEAAPDDAQGQLTPLRLQWKGRADYIALVALLSDLAIEKPVLFIDLFDMKPRGKEVEFELKGRVWCWTPIGNRS